MSFDKGDLIVDSSNEPITQAPESASTQLLDNNQTAEVQAKKSDTIPIHTGHSRLPLDQLIQDTKGKDYSSLRKKEQHRTKNGLITFMMREVRSATDNENQFFKLHQTHCS